MNPQNCLIPSEIAEVTSMSSVKKAKLSIINQIILGGLAGAFIAFASEGSNMAAFNLFQNPRPLNINLNAVSAKTG